MEQIRRKRFPGQTGRVLRSMAPRLMPGLAGNGWFPAADLYETENGLVVCMDVSGADPASLSITAEETSITVSGERQYPAPRKVACIHQLEIERGFFERTMPLPKPVDVGRASSELRHGILVVTLPLHRNKGKIRITVE
ncbi:MAG: Hsp20/alpha crystallin family protein [Thermodesulfobacteriota bacterium]